MSSTTLFLRVSRNGIVIKINNECTSKGKIIFVACPIDIRECMKHEWRVMISKLILDPGVEVFLVL